MMPLTLARAGEGLHVCRVGGSAETRKHLSNLGFVSGADIRVVNELAGNLIVQVKDARIALNKDMARRIMVEA